jgi:hypothetical protein
MTYAELKEKYKCHENGIDNYGTDQVALKGYIIKDDYKTQFCIPIEGSEDHYNDEDGLCECGADPCNYVEDYDYDNAEVIVD